MNRTMTRFQIITELRRLREAIVDCEELTNYAREKAFVDIDDAIDMIRENDE